MIKERIANLIKIVKEKGAGFTKKVKEKVASTIKTITGKNKQFTRTNLEWDNYIDYLIDAINHSKFSKRSETKPMATPKGADESHITSRARHQRLVAEIAKRIAKELGLNENYIYAGMLMHDAGHPFSAHEGEEIFNILGRIYNTGYYHHNAKGVEVILGEDICTTAINNIPGIENNPELRKRLEEEFYCILDAVISHDGEATKKDLKKQATKYSSMKEAVFAKLRLSNSENKYKFIAQDIEGRIGKFADVIAYLATDIQDAFRSDIMTNFNDEYLEVFGEMFSKDENSTREEKIDFAKSLIKEETISKLYPDLRSPENRNMAEYINEIFAEIDVQGIDMWNLTDEDNKKLEQIVESKIASIIDSTTVNNDEEKQMLNAEMSKLRDFMTKMKMSELSTDVVEAITIKMQEYFINDIIENSKKTGRLEYSKKAEDLNFKIKGLNYKYYVQHSKWDYQTKGQPEAAQKLVKDCKEALIKSGAIRDMLYNGSIRNSITDAEARKHMKTPKREESEYLQYKRKIGIPSVPDESHTYTEENPKKLKLFKDVYDFAKKNEGMFAIKYMNVFNAIPHTVRDNVECALNDELTSKSMLEEFQYQANEALRARMLEKYSTIENARNHQEEFISILIDEERNNMEEKMAIQLAIDYISGMTDRSFNELAFQFGYMTEEQVKNSGRGNTLSPTVIKQMELEAAENSDEAQNKGTNSNTTFRHRYKSPTNQGSQPIGTQGIQNETKTKRGQTVPGGTDVQDESGVR